MPLRRTITRLVDLFWGPTEDPVHGLFTDLPRAHRRARTLTRCYYVGLLLVALRHLMLWDDYVGLRAIQPLWPVAWASPSSGRAAAAILVLLVVGSLLAAIVPDSLSARCLAFAGCFEFVAFVNSFGSIRHVHHLIVLTTFLFILLPRGHGWRLGRRRPPPGGPTDDDAKRAYLRAFWGVQCGVLLTYSMSGLAKFAGGFWTLATGQGGVLMPEAFALHVANSAFRFGVEPPLAELVIRAGGLGLPLYLAAFALETLSLPIAFRPRLHRAWGAGLIVMHVAISLTLNLHFLTSILVLAVVLLPSPFAPAWRGPGRMAGARSR